MKLKINPVTEKLDLVADDEIYWDKTDTNIHLKTSSDKVRIVGDGSANSGQLRVGLSATEYIEVGHRGYNTSINAVGDGDLDFRHDGVNKMELDSSGNLNVIGEVTADSFSNQADGTAQGQMSFWDATLGKWVMTETSEMFWDDVNKRVGLGIDFSPLAGLHIKPNIKITGNDGSYPSVVCETFSSTNWHGSFYNFYKTRGTRTSPTVIGSGDTIFSFDLWGYDGNSNEKGAQLIGSTDGAVSDELVPMKWQFKTTNQAGVAPQARMTIKASGKVGRGTTTPDTDFQNVGDFKSGQDTTNYFSLASDGEISLHGTARVEKILFFDLTRMKKGVGSPPLENVEDGFRTYDFDKTTDEEMRSTFSGPLEWAPGTDAKFHLGFFVDTAPTTAQNVVWGVEYKSITCDGVFDFTSGTTTVTDIVAIETGTPTNDKKIHCANLTIPSAGLIEEGLLMVRVFRDADHVNDTFDGDARMFNIHIHYFADKLGKAT